MSLQEFLGYLEEFIQLVMVHPVACPFDQG
jgi:hypothetical protein